MAHNELVQSLLKGLDILQIVARSEDGVSLREITEKLGIKKPSAHNLIRTFISRRYLERTGKPVRYRLGIAAVEIGEGYHRRRFLQKSQTVMKSLYKKLPSATITLAELISGEITITLRISPETSGQTEYSTNRTFSPYSSVSALTFQAFMTDRQRKEFRSRCPFYEYGGHLWNSIQELDTFLKKIVRMGYACFEFTGRENPFRAAVPVFGPQKSIKATLGVCLKEFEPSPEESQAYIKLILNTAKTIVEK
jgi:IclR family transcriptional regulator, KDG regulon repressor